MYSLPAARPDTVKCGDICPARTARTPSSSGTSFCLLSAKVCPPLPSECEELMLLTEFLEKLALPPPLIHSSVFPAEFPFFLLLCFRRLLSRRFVEKFLPSKTFNVNVCSSPPSQPGRHFSTKVLGELGDVWDTLQLWTLAGVLAGTTWVECGEKGGYVRA